MDCHGAPPIRTPACIMASGTQPVSSPTLVVDERLDPFL